MPPVRRLATLVFLLPLCACGDDDPAGSAAFSRDRVLPLVASPGKDKTLFLEFDGAAGCRWNPDFWGASLGFDQFSGIAWNTERAGVLVTPQHVVAARHYPLKPGGTLHFYDAEGRCVVRQIPPGAPGKPTVRYLEGDVMVAKLDRPVPPTIRVYPLPDPEGAEQRASWGRLPKAERPVLIATDWQNPAPPAPEGAPPAPKWIPTRTAHPVLLGQPVEGLLRWSFGPGGDPAVDPSYHEVVNLGDSSHPVFWPGRNGLVLASTFTSTGAGPDYGSRKIQEALQKHIDQMGGEEDYQLRTVPLP